MQSSDLYSKAAFGAEKWLATEIFIKETTIEDSGDEWEEINDYSTFAATESVALKQPR